MLSGGNASLQSSSDRPAPGPRGPTIAAVSAVGMACGICFKGFENYVEKHGSQDLARFSFTSLGLIAMGIYCHALYMLAEEERRRG